MKEMAGTIPYTAPEQLQGKPQPASDQYALGIVVYEWLSGECPFQGTPNEIVGQHLSVPPPPLYGRIPGISPAVEKAVFIALAKEPQQRFPSVQTFATALEQAVLYGSFSASPMSISSNGAVQSAGPIQRPISSLSSFLPSQTTSTNTPSYQSQLSMGGPAPWSNHMGQNISQQGNPLVPPPPPGFVMQNPASNINTSSFGRASESFAPQVPSMAPRQEAKQRSHKGLMIAVIVLVVLLVAVTSAGATYFFASKPSSSNGSGTQGTGPQTQPSATLPQTGTSTTATNAPTDTPTLQATATAAMGPTVITTSAWGPDTKNQPLICISNCNDANNSFDVTLVSINIDTKLSTMKWNLSITDRGNVCTSLYGSIKLIDPTGTEIDANGGTFIESSSINSGQTLPKTATFSVLPQQGVLYEVQINAGYYAGSTYQPEHFQR
jgi:serine/threonine protein kinase